MDIVIVSDAWKPQINGVVQVLSKLRESLVRMNHKVTLLTPDLFSTIACPTYPEIRLAIGAKKQIGYRIEELRPDAIHIATEGPLGWAARSICIEKDWSFTTSFYTKFPEYLNARCWLPLSLGYLALRYFHQRSSRIMVTSKTMQHQLMNRGFNRVSVCTPGVDTVLFRPRLAPSLRLPRPIFLSVARIAVEKNLPAFLELKLPGSKIIVGYGPLFEKMRRLYPDVYFAGSLQGEALASCYAAADVFVFPSRTDTFGLVILEALASGIPVAAFPVPGPFDIIADSGAGAGILDNDLGSAAINSLEISPIICREHAMKFNWSTTANTFLNGRCFTSDTHPLRL